MLSAESFWLNSDCEDSYPFYHLKYYRHTYYMADMRWFFENKKMITLDFQRNFHAIFIELFISTLQIQIIFHDLTYSLKICSGIVCNLESRVELIH